MDCAFLVVNSAQRKEKEMKKKVFGKSTALALAVIIVFTLLPGMAMAEENEIEQTEVTVQESLNEQLDLQADIVDSGTCGDDITWTLDSYGTLVISGEGYIGLANYGPLRTYWEEMSINKVIIKEGITGIGMYAFMHCSLTSIEFPSSLTSIGASAFSDCINLEGIIIPYGVTQIDINPFTGCCSLESIIVDENNSVYDSRNNCNAIIATESNELLTGCKILLSRIA